MNVTTKPKYSYEYARDRRLWIAVPEEGRRNRYVNTRGEEIVYLPTERESLKWHKLPEGVFESKSYPVCACGRKFVPKLFRGKHTKRCYFCR